MRSEIHIIVISNGRGIVPLDRALRWQTDRYRCLLRIENKFSLILTYEFASQVIVR